MKYLKHIRESLLIESNYLEVRGSWRELERQFLIYDKVVEDINNTYDNFKVIHRGNVYYDIKFKIEETSEFILIGVWNLINRQFSLWTSQDISHYRSSSAPFGGKFNPNDTINIDADLYDFEVMVHAWYDLYSEIY